MQVMYFTQSRWLESLTPLNMTDCKHGACLVIKFGMTFTIVSLCFVVLVPLGWGWALRAGSKPDFLSYVSAFTFLGESGFSVVGCRV